MNTLQHTHGKLYVSNQKNLSEPPFMLAEKFRAWKEQQAYIGQRYLLLGVIQSNLY